MVALLCLSGCLDVPGIGGADGDGDSDADASTAPADGGGGPPVDAGGVDASSCGPAFSVAHVDLIHSAPDGGILDGIALLVAGEDPLALAELEVGPTGDSQFAADLTVPSDDLAAPGEAHGALEATAEGQISLVIDPDRWAAKDQPVLSFTVRSAVTLPSTYDIWFDVRVGKQRADVPVRVRYGAVFEGIRAQRAAITKSSCVE